MNATAASPAPRNWFIAALRQPVVLLGIAVWILFSVAIPFLAQGVFPFDQVMPKAPYAVRVGSFILGPAISFIFIVVTGLVTRRRKLNIAGRAPNPGMAMRETLGLLAYGAAVLIAGQFVGHAVGTHGIGLHLAGSMFGLSDTVTPREAICWSLYNFVFYGLLPYWFFRRRGYSAEQLCLKSSNLLNDTLLVAIILAIGLAVDLPGAAIWRLNAHQLAAGAALAFVLSFFGTALPIMIFLTCILVPRYFRLTGSPAAACVLSGLTYASLHLAEYWTRYDSPAHAALSVVCIVLFFGGPGMVKGYLTLRTGNAWVHLWGFHVFWPHVSGDTPIFVKIFGLR
ncbi:MAG: hypothetical protein ACRD50_07725 [Candidatus Acidiferrales bacterium]